MKYSKIEQILQQNTENKEYNIQLVFRIRTLQQKYFRQKLLYQVELQNSTDYFSSYFIDRAAELLKYFQNEKSEQVKCFQATVIKINQWKIKKTEQSKILFVVLDFDLQGEDYSIYDASKIDLSNIRIETYPQPKKFKITFCNNNLNIPNVRKRVKMDLNQTIFDSIDEQQSTIKETKQSSDMYLISNLKNQQSKFNTQTVQYFRIQIMDKQQNVIIGYFYNKVCDKFFKTLDFGKIYRFSNAKCQSSVDKQRLYFQEQSLIIESNELLPKYKQLECKYNINQINQITDEQLTEVNYIDILAYVAEVQYKKERIVLDVFDESGSITIYLWGDIQKQRELSKGDVIAFYRLKCKKYQKVHLNSCEETFIGSEYDEERVNQLKQFGQNQWTKVQDQSYQIEDIENITMLCSEVIMKKQTNPTLKKIIFGTIVSISLVNPFYPSCSSKQCTTKVIWIEQKQCFICQRCYKETLNPIYRFRISSVLADSTGSMEATLFDESMSKMMPISANELQKLTEEQQHELFNSLIGSEFQFQLTINFKEEQGFIKQNVIVQDIEKIDFKKWVPINLQQLIYSLEMKELFEI